MTRQSRLVLVEDESSTRESLVKALVIVLGVCAPFLAVAQDPMTATAFKITGFQVSKGNAIVSWQGGGATNQLQRAASLSGPWQNLGPRTTGTSATNPLAGAIGFFRLLSAGGTTGLSVALTNPMRGTTISATM